jgi:hypothetical protein
MPEGAHFNVLIPPTPSDAFVHTATAANTNTHITYIDHPATNGRPNAFLMVTQNWNPGGTGSTYNDHSIAVWYSQSRDQWAIYNQDRDEMRAGAGFNVLLPPTGTFALIHGASSDNITSNWTTIDHPLTNGEANAIVQVVLHWGPGGTAGRDNPRSIGVWYDSRAARWGIFNQDRSDMPENAGFNVLMFAHTSFIPIP